MPSKKRASGGKRAAEKKRRLREAARARVTVEKKSTKKTGPVGWSKDDFVTKAKKLGLAPVGKAERGHTYIADVVLLAIQDAINDPGPEPEQRREQIGRLVAQAAKVMEPAKLSTKLAEFERALEELRSASPISQGEDGATRPFAPLT